VVEGQSQEIKMFLIWTTNKLSPLDLISMKTSKKNTFESLSFDVLNDQEMSVVIGGKRRRPKSRDRDHFDEEDERGRKRR